MNNFNIKLPDDVQFIIHTLQLHGFEAYAVVIRTVMIPKDNEEDLEDVAEEVKRQLTIVPVSSVSQVLEKTGL